ncbi:MAG: DUF554 domain-containing protein [Chloroflexi bacterium]|nr:DUF554 domain-containing protein [Chloroflexota bacterium]MQC26182.1 DUF554 domain-containing protein [Chloroflexota bacterium]
MIGTLINIAAVVVGSLLGLGFGARIPERTNKTIIAGLGLFTAAIGFQMFLGMQNAIVVLVSILLGGLLGEWWRIESRLEGVGEWLQQRFAAGQHGDSSRFVTGFLTASLVFCVGPMTILGSIQDGLTGDFRLLAIKSVLDAFASLVFASTLGVGVLFSALTILVVQGGISLLANQFATLFTQPMIAELTAVGGLLLIGIAISSLLEIKPIRMGNFLPALVIAPAIISLLTYFGINFVF